MSYKDILYEGVIGRREKKCRCPEKTMFAIFEQQNGGVGEEGEEVGGNEICAPVGNLDHVGSCALE